jgi:predicted O-linked N-acetylglucosamine transferase (SPINDLY family)
VRKKRRGETIFLCSHSLNTQLPQHDQLFVRIAEALPKSVFWFVADRARPVTEQFHRRLARAFTEAGLDAEARLVVHPRMDHQDFLALNRRADILLDTLLWSGHNSTFDSMACGLPIVTLPCPMMRGRHTYAILKMMELEELIATDEDDYVAIATRLATDGRWRRRIAKKIEQRSPVIFEDEAPVKAFEEFLEGVCGAGSQIHGHP